MLLILRSILVFKKTTLSETIQQATPSHSFTVHPMEKPKHKPFACIPNSFLLVQLLLFSFLTLNPQSWGVIAQNATSASVRVGVVIDLSIPSGMRARTSIAMAIEDFYIANPNYSTRISFNFKEYHDSIGAASAGTFPNFSYPFLFPFCLVFCTSSILFFCIFIIFLTPII